MSKYIRTVICLVLLATAIGPLAAQDAAICEALRAIHASQGDSLVAYLSVKGKECLEPAATPTPVPTATPSGPIWSAAGKSTANRPVSLKLTRGVYKLDAPVPVVLNGEGYANLEDIISVPDACFVWETVSFPSRLNIERDCTIHATLKIDFGLFVYTTKPWKLEISKESNQVPPVPKADGWKLSGRGDTKVPLELIFDPGVYRMDVQGGHELGFAEIRAWHQSPTRCLPQSFVRLPTQFRLDKTCRIKASLWIGIGMGQVKSWSYSIMKLD